MQISEIQASQNTTLTGTKWSYFSMSAEAATPGFNLQISSSESFDVYVLKGTDKIPDPSNFDALVKREKTVTFTNHNFDVTNGFVVAVYSKLDRDCDMVTLQIESTSVQLTSLMAASAEPNAQPKPGFDLPKPLLPPSSDPDANQFITDMQYMLIGAVLGVFGTLIYYNCARLQQRFLESRGQTVSLEDPNLFLKSALPRTLFNSDSDEEKDDLKKRLP